MREPTRPAAEISWASDHALLVRLGEEATDEVRARVLGLLRLLQDERPRGLGDLHPGYRSLLVELDPLAVDPARFEEEIRVLAARARPVASAGGRLVEIPVCYAATHAPDLADVARACDLDEEEVVRLHASSAYVVRFLGFVAGFPYLDGLSSRLAVPRLASPRKKVPAGSVAIAASQAGIYPLATPGGWRILGRTPLPLFRAEEKPPALLAPGDRVRFVPIDEAEFRRLLARSSGG